MVSRVSRRTRLESPLWDLPPDRPQDLVPRLPLPRPLLRDRRITEHRRAEATRRRYRFRVSRETSVPRPARPDRARLMYLPVSLPSPSAFFKTLPETSTVHFSALPLLFPSTARTESVETDPARKFKLESVSARTDRVLLPHPLQVPLQVLPHLVETMVPHPVRKEMRMYKSKEWMDHSAVPSAETTDPAPLTSHLELPESLSVSSKIRAETSSVLLHVFLFFLISRMSAVRVPARASRVSFSESVPIPIRLPLVVSSPLPCNLFDSW